MGFYEKCEEKCEDNYIIFASSCEIAILVL